MAATWQDVLTQLKLRSLKDPSFAAAFHHDPRGVLQDQMNSMGITTPLPPNLKINVLQDSPGTVHVVLPPAPHPGEIGTLTDDQLHHKMMACTCTIGFSCIIVTCATA